MVRLCEEIIRNTLEEILTQIFRPKVSDEQSVSNFRLLCLKCKVRRKVHSLSIGGAQ